MFQVQMENNSEIEAPQENVLYNNVAAEISDVVISIEGMLKKLPPVNEKSSIYRVSKQLHDMNPKAYTPQIISIGPFHHRCDENDKNDFRAMEQYKLQGLNKFLRRITNKIMKYPLEEDVAENRLLEDLNLETKSLKFLVKKAHFWMKEVRNCYTEPIDMNDRKFLIMMLVDACFIVEFFMLKCDRKFDSLCHKSSDQIKGHVDLLLPYPEMVLDILFDLIKLENQVPFFLLQNLFNLILIEDSSPRSFKDITYFALGFCFGFINECTFVTWTKEPKHLVDFLSFHFIPLPSSMQNEQHEKNSENKYNFLSFFYELFLTCWQKQHEENNEQNEENIEQNEENSETKKNKDILSFFRVPLCCLWNKKPDENKSEEGRLIPPSITELHEAGVTIKKAENTKYFMNITFKNGVLEIPPLHIYDCFELILRNMVAFEQFSTENDNHLYVTQYVSFLDDLISTKKDVSLLMKAGVIINNIGGSNTEVSNLFNNLCKFVTYPKFSQFDPISKALREHCDGRWNKAKASLKHNYFNSPWAIISLFAASFLILLTLLQTIFSAISTFHS